MNFFESSLDPYKILGLPLKADWELIKATYKSLIKIYHPDVFKGDKNFAANRLADLNNAYEFLSDPKKKERYDRNIDDGTQEQDEYRPNENEDEQTEAINALKDDWNFACEYYPHLPDEFNKLKKLSKQTALIFMATLVEKKLYHESGELMEYLENYFLTSKFGDDDELREIARYAIYCGEKRYALELNRSLIRLGLGSKEAILTKLSLQFPDIGYDVLINIARGDLVASSNPHKQRHSNSPTGRFAQKEHVSTNENDGNPGQESFLKLVSSIAILVCVIAVISAISVFLSALNY